MADIITYNHNNDGTLGACLGIPVLRQRYLDALLKRGINCKAGSNWVEMLAIISKGLTINEITYISVQMGCMQALATFSIIPETDNWTLKNNLN